MSDPVTYATEVSVSESQRQSDVAAAEANFAGVTKAIATADRAHFGRVLASAFKNSMNAPNVLQAWRAAPPANDAHTATDTTTFHLDGGRYLVTATATWGGGTVTLQDSLGATFATFTADGSVTVDLRYGTYALTIATATGVSVTVKTKPYVPEWTV